MAYILEKIGNTYNLPKKYFTCDAKSDLDGISLVDVPIGSEAYCILEEESYILDSNKQWHKKKIGEDLTGQVQADLSQTDSTQADYVKGIIRKESLPEGYPYKCTYTISWDGNKDGLLSVEYAPGYVFYKVSDFIIDRDNLLSLNYTLSNGLISEGGVEQTISVSDAIWTDSGACFMVVKEPTKTEQGITFPESGLYLMGDDTNHVNKVSFSYVKRIDKEYIPKLYATDIYGTVPVANGGVPTCTTANNGQFLRVIDGIPTWTEFLPTLTSPNGTKYQLTVSDDGTLSAMVVS